MSYKVKYCTTFERNVADLKKRYPHVVNHVKDAIGELQKRPNLGEVIPRDFGLRKLRLPNKDLQRGKRGGYRLIYNVTEEVLEFICLYSKTDKSDITLRELRDALTDRR